MTGESKYTKRDFNLGSTAKFIDNVAFNLDKINDLEQGGFGLRHSFTSTLQAGLEPSVVQPFKSFHHNKLVQSLL